MSLAMQHALVAVILALMTLATAEAVHRNQAGVVDGYAYAGHGDLRRALQQVDAAQPERLRTSKQHNTVLMTADGHIYTKRNDPQLAARRLQQGGSAGAAAAPPVTPLPTLAPSETCLGCPITDTRMMVMDTTMEPWSSVGILLRDLTDAGANTDSQCTGTLVGAARQHVLTAAHCVVDAAAGSPLQNVNFLPSKNGPDQNPFPPTTGSRVRVLDSFLSAVAGSGGAGSLAALEYDFALVTLQALAPTGTTTFPMGTPITLNSVPLQTCGYPIDKMPAQSMWMLDCPANNISDGGAALPPLPGTNTFPGNIGVHSCITTTGQAGSAIWSWSSNETNAVPTLRLIATGSIPSTNAVGDPVTLNVGVKMNTFVSNTINGWLAEDGQAAPLPAPAAAPASAPAAAPAPATAAPRPANGAMQRASRLFGGVMASAVSVGVAAFAAGSLIWP